MKIPFVFTLNFYILQGNKNSLKDDKLVAITAKQAKESAWVYKYFPEDLCLKRWNNGVTLYYLVNDVEQPCCFVWSRIGRTQYVGEINKQLVFPSDVHCFIDAITPPEFRGNGYYTQLMKAVADELSEYTSIAYAYKTNIISNKGLVKSGFTLTHILYYFFRFVKVVPIKESHINFNVR